MTASSAVPIVPGFSKPPEHEIRLGVAEFKEYFVVDQPVNQALDMRRAAARAGGRGREIRLFRPLHRGLGR